MTDRKAHSTLQCQRQRCAALQQFCASAASSLLNRLAAGWSCLTLLTLCCQPAGWASNRTGSTCVDADNGDAAALAHRVDKLVQNVAGVCGKNEILGFGSAQSTARQPTLR